MSFLTHWPLVTWWCSWKDSGSEWTGASWKILPTALCQILPKSVSYLTIFYFSHCFILLLSMRISKFCIMLGQRGLPPLQKLSREEKVAPIPTQGLHFSDPFAVSCGHVIEFWSTECEWKWCASHLGMAHESLTCALFHAFFPLLLRSGNSPRWPWKRHAEESGASLNLCLWMLHEQEINFSY